MVCRLAFGFACLPQIVFTATPERNSFCCYDNWSFPFKVYTHNSFCVLILLNPSSAYSGRDWRNDMYNSWGKSPQRTDEIFWQECLLASPEEYLPKPTTSKNKQEARGQELCRGCCYHTDALKAERSQSKEEILSLIFLDRSSAQVCSKWLHPMVSAYSFIILPPSVIRTEFSALSVLPHDSSILLSPHHSCHSSMLLYLSTDCMLSAVKEECFCFPDKSWSTL